MTSRFDFPSPGLVMQEYSDHPLVGLFHTETQSVILFPATKVLVEVGNYDQNGDFTNIRAITNTYRESSELTQIECKEIHNKRFLGVQLAPRRINNSNSGGTVLGHGYVCEKTVDLWSDTCRDEWRGFAIMPLSNGLNVKYNSGTLNPSYESMGFSREMSPDYQQQLNEIIKPLYQAYLLKQFIDSTCNRLSEKGGRFKYKANCINQAYSKAVSTNLDQCINLGDFINTVDPKCRLSLEGALFMKGNTLDFIHTPQSKTEFLKKFSISHTDVLCDHLPDDSIKSDDNLTRHLSA